MESNIELSAHPATYKQIPENDSEIKPKALAPLESDGADEEMLPKEKKPEVSEKVADVKFATNEKQNGEMKVDIGNYQTAFVGISKEELLKYANDPFWVRLRWILFILFWLVWLAMLAGAIIIIIAAPKCSPPAPRTWWEQGPLTEVSADLPEDALKELHEDNFAGVIVSVTDDSYDSMNESSQILAFLKHSKSLGVNVIIELDPSKSDNWLKSSEKKEDPFADYYIWVDYSSMSDNEQPVPPNNWLSPGGGSAWKFSPERKQFYYSPNGGPHLNFRNPLVIDEFSEIVKYWLDQGAKGIRLRGAPYLLVDESYANESLSSGHGYIHDQYNFYSHSKTTNVAGIGNVLAEWKEIVKNNTDNGPFMIKEDLNSLESYLVNEVLSIDLPRHSQLFTNPERLTSAAQIYEGLNSAFAILNKHWPLWEIGKDLPLTNEVLQITTMLLPGTHLLSSDVAIVPQLLKIREGASIMYGTYHRELLANKTVFAYNRVAAGNPGYLIAFNPSETLVNVDFTTMHNVSSEVTIQVLSSNYSIPDMRTSLKIPADDVKMPPKSALVLTYVPKST